MVASGNCPYTFTGEFVCPGAFHGAAGIGATVGKTAWTDPWVISGADDRFMTVL